MLQKLGRILTAIRGHAKADDLPSIGARRFDLVISYADEDREPTKRKFDTPEARQTAADDYVSRSLDGKISALVFEDRTTIWRLSKATPELPIKMPDIAGEGELVFQVLTSGNGLIEVGDFSRSSIEAIVTSLSKSMGPMIPREAAVIHRRPAYESAHRLVPVS